MLWMDEFSITASFYFYFAYIFYLVVSCTGMVLRRKHYLFRKNPLGIILCGALMQALICTVHLLRFWTLNPLGAKFMLWRNYVIFPLCIVFSMQAAGMHILFEVIWTKSINNLSSARVDAKTWARMSWLERARLGLRNPRLHVWLKNKGIYLMAFSLTAMHVFMATFIQLAHDSRDFNMNERSITSILSFGLALWVVLYMVVWCPLMLFLLRNVKDAYGLRRDLQNGISYGFPCYLLYVCVRSYPFMQTIRAEVPSFFLLTLSMSCLHFATVTVPLVRSLFWIPEELPADDEPGLLTSREASPRTSSPHDLVIPAQGPSEESTIVIPHRPIPLERVLDNPGLSRAFEEYSKSAFVYDSVLFHRTVQRFRMVTTIDPNALLSEALKIRDQYIEPGAPCEMNLSYEVVRQIETALLIDDLSPTMFDEAQSEILRLVGNCTYRNFLYTLPPSEKARYMMPVGILMPRPAIVAADRECPEQRTPRRRTGATETSGSGSELDSAKKSLL